MRLAFVLITFGSTMLSAHAQSHAWSFALGGVEQDEAQSLATDAFGHLYVAGWLNNDTVDMDPGAATDDQLCSVSALASYTLDGQYRWSYAFEGGGFAVAQVAAARNGDVVIAGRWSGSGDLDPGPGVASPQANGPGDMVVARYDSLGDHLWSFNIGGNSSEPIGGVALDSVGNVYISGLAYGGCDFDPGQGTNVPFPFNGVQYNFLAKYDPNGDLLWVRMLLGPAFFRAPAVAVDGAGNAYLTGSVGDSLNMDPGLTSTVIHDVGPVEDVFLARYRPDGSLHWAGVIGGSLDGYAFSIAANDVGRVAVAGTFRGYYDFDMSTGTTNLMATTSGAYDAFVAVYDSTSVLHWAKRFGNFGLDKATAVAMDAQGEVAVAGYYSGTMSISGFTILGHGWDDAFLVRLDTGGTVQWAFGVGTNDYDEAMAVAMASDGSTYLGGYFNNTIDLDPGIGTVDRTVVGATDLFVARYDGLATAVASRNHPTLTAFPNPTSDVLQVLVRDAGTTYTLIDALGQVVGSGRLVPGANILDLTALPSGAYLLRTDRQGGAVRVLKHE